MDETKFDRSTLPPILAAAMQHYDDLGILSMTIPEWPIDGKPGVVRWKPLTQRERAKFYSTGIDANGQVLLDAYPGLIIAKALNPDGSKMFTIEHKPFLMNDVLSEVVTRLGARMLFGEIVNVEKAVEERLKNLGAIASD